jgi:uncharacterized protein YndB with AHSA1/START domain
VIHVESSTVIRRPIADVFAYLTDPSKESSWHSDVREAKPLTNGPTGVGTRTGYAFPGPGRLHRTVGRVTAFDPPRSATIALESGPMGMRPTVTLRFEQVEGGTRFTRAVDIAPTGVGRLLAPLLGRAVTARNARFVENARRVLEAV